MQDSFQRGGRETIGAAEIRFILNGERQSLRNPNPRLLLIDWLRDSAGLTGTKKGCGQGGCGICTVMVSRWDAKSQTIQHEAINSCLRPVCSLDGMVITTVEGVGSTAGTLNPVQYRIAADNGSQCGYCTPGWVMTMTAALAARLASGAEAPTQLEIEQLFDGNLCRCTGYRPILFAMRHFARDWSAKDEGGCMTCCIYPDLPHNPTVAEPVVSPPPPPEPLRVEQDGYTWIRPTSLAVVLQLMQDLPPEDVKLVHGNTSIGIYDRYQENPSTLIDISGLAELKACCADDHAVQLGAGITYAELLAFLQSLTAAPKDGDTGLAALAYMAGRTAGSIVRNAASLGGNTMLVVRHVQQGVPFPSDLFSVLAALDAEILLAAIGQDEPVMMPVLRFAEAWHSDPRVRRMVLLGYRVPRARPGEFVQAYKVALREVNAHSIVNAGFRVRFDGQGRVEAVALVLGGIAPICFHARRAESVLLGEAWTSASLRAALAALRLDVDEALERWAERLRSLPDEGFTTAYRRHLAESYLYKFFVEVALATGAFEVPPELRSAGRRYERPLSRGSQFIPKNQDPPPVGLPFIKQDAFLQATGEAQYTHDLPLPHRGLQGAFVLSRKAIGRFHFVLPDTHGMPVRPSDLVEHLRTRFRTLTRLLTADDLPWQSNNLTAAVEHNLGGTDPLFAKDEVQWHGQPIALVLAEDATEAIDAAHYIRHHCVAYPGPPAESPLFTIDEALAANSVFVDTPVPPYNHILRIQRPDSLIDWAGKPGEAAVNGQRCQVFTGEQRSGSQAHFYMETQSVLALPDDGTKLIIHPSSQSPSPIQAISAAVTGLPLSAVGVEVKRVGGGYGGKTTRSTYMAVPAALAAHQMRRPVRIAARREEDTEMFGRRHAYRGTYSVAITTSAPRGKILGMAIDFVSNGGATYDCSFVVMDCVQMRIDSAYMIPNWQTTGQVARTNLATGTAFRSMGLIQGVLVLEDAISQAAYGIGMRAEDVREVNLYQQGQSTVIGATLDPCYMQGVWQYTRDTAQFDERAAAIDAFNASNRWRKRGIALIPVQYGAGYNAAFLEQAGALVEAYSNDGSVLVHQGGIEIGQGLAIKIAQVAAQTLNLPLDTITIADTNLRVVPNPTSTGASTGTGFNAEAVRTACQQLRDTVESYCFSLLRKHGPAWCAENHVDFWNYREGWQHWLTGQHGKPGRMMWQAILSAAYMDRVNLSAQVRVAIPGGDTPAQNLYFASEKTKEEGVDQFTGYTYSAACCEVEIDVLTGETTVLRADLVYDIGDSLNPAIDIGQVEGAFVQGLGYVLTEEIVIETDGADAGRLNSPNTWAYKIPATTTIPLEFNVGFFPRAKLGLPTETDVVFGSKEVGEPPLVLAAAAFFAVKNAVLAARRDRGHHGWFQLQAPATVQRIREACLVEQLDLVVSDLPEALATGEAASRGNS
jgi:xanthine dehydrogenase/oxidase